MWLLPVPVDVANRWLPVPACSHGGVFPVGTSVLIQHVIIIICYNLAFLHFILNSAHVNPRPRPHEDVLEKKNKVLYYPANPNSWDLRRFWCNIDLLMYHFKWTWLNLVQQTGDLPSVYLPLRRAPGPGDRGELGHRSLSDHVSEWAVPTSASSFNMRKYKTQVFALVCQITYFTFSFWVFVSHASCLVSGTGRLMYPWLPLLHVNYPAWWQIILKTFPMPSTEASPGSKWAETSEREDFRLMTGCCKSRIGKILLLLSSWSNCSAVLELFFSCSQLVFLISNHFFSRFQILIFSLKKQHYFCRMSQPVVMAATLFTTACFQCCTFNLLLFSSLVFFLNGQD